MALLGLLPLAALGLGIALLHRRGSRPAEAVIALLSPRGTRDSQTIRDPPAELTIGGASWQRVMQYPHLALFRRSP